MLHGARQPAKQPRERLKSGPIILATTNRLSSTFGSSNTNASVSGNRNYATGQATTTSSGFGVATSRYCTVNVTMVDGRVSRLNYIGPTGGLLTAGEQCAFAVQNCTQ